MASVKKTDLDRLWIYSVFYVIDYQAVLLSCVIWTK
jgi:hypothetical protein